LVNADGVGDEGVAGGTNGTVLGIGGPWNVPSAVIFSLLGKIGGSTAFGSSGSSLLPPGKPGKGLGFVGSSYSQTVLTSGRLFLGFNDDVFGDNSGSFSVTINVLDPADIAMQSAHLVSGNTVQFTYATTGNPGPFQVGFYQSADATFDASDTFIMSQPVTPNPIGGPGSGTFTLPPLPVTDGTKPYILTVADPPSAAKPKGDIIESNDTDLPNHNNTASFQLHDIAMQSAQLVSGNTVEFTYTTTGNPGSFQVGLYRSANGVAYNAADRIGDLLPITPAMIGPQSPGTFMLPNPWTPDPTKPYLIVVADPADVIRESSEINNNASFQLPQVTVEMQPVGNPIMGEDYQLRVRLANNANVPVTLTLGAEEKYITVVNWKERAKNPDSVTVTLAPGETRIVVLGTFNHSWEWLPKDPPTIPSDVASELYSQIAPGLGGLLTQLLGILGKLKTKDVMDNISGWFSTFNTQLDIVGLFQQVHPVAQVNYPVIVRYTDGTVAFSQTVPVNIRVSQEQQRHLQKHVLYFILAEQFKTNIPVLDLVLEDAFKRLAKDEYKAALKTK